MSRYYRGSRGLKQNRQSGFTLLEVMVALAILAVVAVAASQASRSYSLSVGNMKTRTQAYFVAQNALADLRIQQKWLTNEQQQQVEENGQTWQVTISPSATDFDTLKKLSIAVAPVSEGKAQHNLVTLESVLAKPTQNPVYIQGAGQ